MNEQIIPAHKRVDLSDLVWLLYLVFFFIEPLYRHSIPYWFECLGVTLVFVAVYFAFLRYSHLQIRLALLGVMFLMGANLYFWNQGAPAFMIYSAALLPLTLGSVPVVLGLLVAEAVIMVLLGSHLQVPSFSYGINAIMLLIVGGANIFSAQRLRADRKLRMKQEEIEALAAVAERERIARDLHDVLGHTLSVIVLKTELAGRLLDRHLEATSDLMSPSAHLSSRPERAARSGDTRVFPTTATHSSEQSQAHDPTALHRARTELADVERTARTALAEVREAIGGYRARGLAAEIDAARQTLATAGVSLSTEGDLQPVPFSAAEETVLALALREAVTNIVRHAQATECRLTLTPAGDSYRLSVQDNGRHSVTREGNGLRGMRERVEGLGGQLSLVRENGTDLRIVLPLRSA